MTTTNAQSADVSSSTTGAGSARIRQPGADDGPVLHDVISRCGGLDVNSLYCYLLIADAFAATSAIAELDGSPVGCVTGLRLPERPSHLFIWQVAVLPDGRGRGIGPAMMQAILERPGHDDIAAVEATVGPDNSASRRMFGKLAEALGAPIAYEPGFPADLFPAGHGAEDRLLIGPFPAVQTARFAPAQATG